MNPMIIILISSVLPAIILFLLKRSYFREIVMDIRPGRILHYYVLFIFGFVLYKSSYLELIQSDFETIIELILYLMVLIYSAVFAIASNNKEDLQVDEITNKNRPLVRKVVDPKIYLRIARISLAFSLILAAIISVPFFISILSISLIYYLYSCKPFKLKRFVFLAKFLIGINSLISAICGFVTAGGSLENFPIFWMLFILIPVSLMANFVDLKDTEGDRHAGVKTLPVIFGEDKAKKMIAVFAIFTYFMVFTYFDSVWIIQLLVVSVIVHLFFLFRKPYLEKPLFFLHNFLFIGLILLILLDKEL